jgi:hypothetical protein
MTSAAVNAEPIYYDPFDYEIDQDPYQIWNRTRGKRFPTWEIDDSELVPVHTSTVRGYRSVPIHF